MKLAKSWMLLVAVLPLWAQATERVVLAPALEDVTVTVLESSSEQVVVQLDVNAFEMEAVEIGGEKYAIPSIKHESILLNAGEPGLPRLCRSIIIPDDAEMELEILASTFRDFPDLAVAPSKGNLPRTVNPADVPYTFGDVYKGNAWYPADLATLREPFILRDLRGTVIELNAFRYLPSQRTLRVYTSVTVAVKTAGPGRINVLRRNGPLSKMDPMFAKIYERQFVNWNLDDTRYTPVFEDGEMLIITYDSFAATMAAFKSWKIQKGIKTTMVNVSVVGNNSTSIRTYIQNFYNNSGGNLAYVLLVGDAAQVATPSASGGAADPTYAKVAGGDNYPDIFVGRFSAENTTHVSTQVERSVEYERDAVTGNVWLSRATGIASAEGAGIGHNGEIDYQHMNLIRTDLLTYGYTPVDQVYDPGATATMVSTALNAGRGLVNYTGHGSELAWTTSGFSTTNIGNLTNDNMLPFIFSVACVNGNFTYSSPCFAEVWLRSTRSGEPIGALATYMSSINQDWVPPMDAQDEFNDLLCAESKTSFGGLCFNASCRMIELNGTSGVNMFNTWHVFGDPSVQVRTKAPSTMAVSHASTITSGATSFAVTVTGVPGALCAMSRSDSLYGRAYTNAGGLATIPLTGTPAIGQTLKLTVTALNKVTYAADVTVIATTPTITVIAPDGGEIWYAGDVNTIQWTSTNLSENVRIEINRNYPGATWDTIATSTPNDGSHPWTVTGPATGTARIRIRGTVQTAVCDTSNNNFAVRVRSITVTSPNGGETWWVDEGHSITWNSQYLSDNVKIEINRGFPGPAWDVIVASTGNTGSYSWPVTGPATSTARVRVSSLTYPAVMDTSNGNFAILYANEPPSLAHDPLHDQLPVAFTVTAIATDDYPGFTVRMHYWPEGGGIDSVALTATPNPDEFAASVGPLGEGRYQYFVRVRDSNGETAQSETFGFEVRAAPGSEIAYDDGTAEASHWSDQAGYRWAVKFDPPQVPYLLTAARIGISAENPDAEHSPIAVEVRLADGFLGTPGTVLLSKTAGSIGNVIGGVPPENDGWTHVALCDAGGSPLVLSGPFYICVANPDWQNIESFLHDTSSTYAGRSFVWDPCDSVWYGEDAAHSSTRRGNRMIRAVGLALPVPNLVVQEQGGYIRLHWGDTNAPVYHVFSAPDVSGPFGAIGVTSDTTFTVARTDTADTRRFYRVTAATE